MGQREDVQASLIAGHGVEDTRIVRPVKGAPHVDFAAAAKTIEADDSVCPICHYDCSRADHHEVTDQIAAVVDTTMNHAIGVSLNRQGWRARLANVERLLADVPGQRDAYDVKVRIATALTEIRAMLDGD